MFENHLLTWLASMSCCIGIALLAVTPVSKSQSIYESNLFLPTYMVGILAWLLHGLELRSLPIIITCAIQVPIVILLLWRSISMRTLGCNNEL